MVVAAVVNRQDRIGDAPATPERRRVMEGLRRADSLKIATRGPGPSRIEVQPKHADADSQESQHSAIMSDKQTVTDNSTAKAPVSTKPVQSIEVESEVKEEDEGEEGSDHENGANEGAEAEEDNDGRPISNTLYRALKIITDILLDYKIKVKFRGNEE